MTSAPRISLCFPVYRDEATVRAVAEKGLGVLRSVTDTFEIIIVDDASPDRSGTIADELAGEHPEIRIVHHPENLGYGAAVKAGLDAARYEWICLTDGDDEYDVRDLEKLLPLRSFYDLVITFRYVKLYSTFRVFVSWVYNRLVRLLFRTPYRDISTGLRLVRKSLVEELTLDSTSPFIGAELAIKTMLRGYRVGEVGIQTFPRQFGRGASVTPKNIRATIVDMMRVYRQVFSDQYELPAGRLRSHDDGDGSAARRHRGRPPGSHP